MIFNNNKSTHGPHEFKGKSQNTLIVCNSLIKLCIDFIAFIKCMDNENMSVKIQILYIQNS